MKNNVFIKKKNLYIEFLCFIVDLFFIIWLVSLVFTWQVKITDLCCIVVLLCFCSDGEWSASLPCLHRYPGSRAQDRSGAEQRRFCARLSEWGFVPGRSGLFQFCAAASLQQRHTEAINLTHPFLLMRIWVDGVAFTSFFFFSSKEMYTHTVGVGEKVTRINSSTCYTREACCGWRHGHAHAHSPHRQGW